MGDKTLIYNNMYFYVSVYTNIYTLNTAGCKRTAKDGAWHMFAPRLTKSGRLLTDRSGSANSRGLPFTGTVEAQRLLPHSRRSVVNERCLTPVVPSTG